MTYYDAGERFRSENGFDAENAEWLELSNEAWSFYTLAAWKRTDGFYLATDSGCSCPTPFENHGTWEDYTGPLTGEQAREEVESLVRDAREDSYSYGPVEEHIVSMMKFLGQEN